MLIPRTTHAQYLAYLTTGARYNNCAVTTTPNGKTIFRVNAYLVGAFGMMSQQGRQFSTWGVGVSFLDRNGNMKTVPSSVQVELNQIPSVDGYGFRPAPLVKFFSGPQTDTIIPAYANSWHRISAGKVDIQVAVNSIDIQEWPGVGINMSIRSTMSDIFLDAPGVYLTESSALNSSACKEFLPGTKPPRPKKKNLLVEAPDWNFGTLDTAQADQDIALSEKFCLSYDPSTIYSEKLTLNVSNLNGKMGTNMFKLVHRDDPTAVIPYSMLLRGTALVGGAYRMPNQGPTAFWVKNFSNSGRTCFDASYTTQVLPTSKPGDYMDTLYLTIANPP
ncbi:hypothetical protein DBR37_11570 [Herminiimonas sp. KBW02]|nr:hypothetical protein DBR37_11570 [Herminiimonas sp. KBW02]